MYKVISIVDKEGTALDRLAKQVAPYYDFEYKVLDVHPKRPSPEQLAAFEAEYLDADIIDFQYFRTAQMLLERYDLSHCKKVLTHNNPYSYKEDTWEWADANVGNNNEITAGLKAQGSPNIHHIPITIDHKFWLYNTEWKPSNTVLMVANRIESKKGILPVAKAVADLNMHFILVGNISDANYFREVMQTGYIEFHENVSDEELRSLYYKSGVHICNSVDNFESGTMPILESMLCGTPVITRSIGHVPDIYNGDNLVINDHQPDDVDHLSTLIFQTLTDTKKLEEMRGVAWNSAKNFNAERRAYEYQRLYRSLKEAEPVSIILPVCDKPEVLRDNLEAIVEQNYPNLELIVVDDSKEDRNSIQSIVSTFADTVSFPVKYIETTMQGYNLAQARNLGIIEATSDILVFCDQRMILDKDCVKEFVENLAPRKWLYGNKGGKKDFVENVSCIYRIDIVRAGMFNERINKYGGMSQEVRVRTRNQGIEHVYIESAKATPSGKSSNRNRKRQEIIEMKNLLYKIGLDQ